VKVVPFAAGQDMVVAVAVAVAAAVVDDAVAVPAEEAALASRAPQTPLLAVTATSVLFM